MSIDFELYSDSWKQDPYSVYRSLRDDSPVHWAPLAGAWCVSRYEDVKHILSHPELFSSKTGDLQRRRTTGAGLLAPLRMALRMVVGMRVTLRTLLRSRMLILEDGDTHALMRNLVNRGFTPRRIQDWEGRISELVEGCLARVRAGDAFDLVSELAIPLPVTVISEMLGIEPERQHDFKRWSDAILTAGTTGGVAGGILGKGLTDAMIEMRRYLGPIVRARRAEPRDDLISILVAAEEGEAALSDHEIFMFFLLLLLAGNETTTNLIGNAVDGLLDNPDQLALVADDLSLVPNLIEETLRWDAPVQFLTRVATEDLEIRGQKIEKGSLVVPIIASANRDERRFPDPDRFDLQRDTRGHLGFGFGAHFCLGASLARLEARKALEGLVPELPGLARVTPEREFLASNTVRGRVRLELRSAA